MHTADAAAEVGGRSDARVEKAAVPQPPAPAPRCPRCEYDLRGLPGDRCPECGLDGLAARLARLAAIPRLGRRVKVGTAWTLGGHALEQCIRFGGNLLLTRLLAPHVFGLMAMVQVAIRAVGFFSDLGTSSSIIRDRRGEDRAFLDTAWTLSVIRGSVVWLVASLLAWPASVLYAMPELAYLIPVAALTSVISGFNSTKAATLNRRLALGKLTMLDAGSQTLGLTIMIGVALVSPTVWALIVGGFATSLSKLAVSHFVMPGPANRFTWEKAAARELVRFGRWVAVSTAITFLLQQGDRLLMGALVNVSTLGVYSVAFFMAQSVLKAMRVMGPRVLLPAYTQLLARGDKALLRRRVFRLRVVLLLIFIPPLLALTLWGGELVRLLYTPPYHDAGWMLQVLAAGNIGSAINLSAGKVVLASGDSFRYMILQISRGVMMIAGMAIGYAVGGVPGLIVGMGASYWLNYPFLAWATRRHGTWMPALDAAVFAVSGLVVLAAWLTR